MGKNGHLKKKSKIPFFSKEKNGRSQKKKKNGQKMGTLKKNVARRQNSKPFLKHKKMERKSLAI